MSKRARNRRNSTANNLFPMKQLIEKHRMNGMESCMDVLTRDLTESAMQKICNIISDAEAFLVEEVSAMDARKFLSGKRYLNASSHRMSIFLAREEAATVGSTPAEETIVSCDQVADEAEAGNTTCGGRFFLVSSKKMPITSELVYVGFNGGLASTCQDTSCHGLPHTAVLAVFKEGYTELNTMLHFHPIYLRSHVLGMGIGSIPNFSMKLDRINIGRMGKACLLDPTTCSWSYAEESTRIEWNALQNQTATHQPYNHPDQNDASSGVKDCPVKKMSRSQELDKLWYNVLKPELSGNPTDPDVQHLVAGFYLLVSQQQEMSKKRAMLAFSARQLSLGQKCNDDSPSGASLTLIPPAATKGKRGTAKRIRSVTEKGSTKNKTIKKMC